MLSIAVCNVSVCLSVCRSTQQIKVTFSSFLEVQVEVCVFQVKYVVEFARALAMMPEVYRVDLLTRQICSPDVDSSYGEPTEMLTSGTYDGGQELGESSGAYIIRIPCGPR
jgi:hypothetical protein